MFKVFSFVLLVGFASLVSAQSDEFIPGDELVTDEYQETEKTSAAPANSETPEATEPNSSQVSEQPASNQEPQVSTEAASPEPQEEGLVEVREQETPSQESAANNEQGLVELRGSQDIFLPYKQRQRAWGYVFSAGAELVTYPGLLSQFTEPDGSIATFEDMFGPNSQTMASFEMGPKYNTSMGSFALLLGYSRLDISSSRIQSKAELRVSRYSANVVYYLDTLWQEPYFVPYVGAGAWQADYEEENEDEPDVIAKYTTDVGFQWRIGGLINLDWIEPATALRSRRTLGLQATFLNLYATSSYMSESNPDPDLEIELDFGASLVVEF
ncbi:MAG: hypothetical protein ACK5Y2_14005 [Bdellovibrionales bacterium]